MNNACPSCGAVYAVTAKDVGRKIKCKKCSSALIVTEDGLEPDEPAAAPPPPPPVVAVEADIAEDEEDGGEEEPVIAVKGKKEKKGKAPYQGGSGGVDLKGVMAKIGGIPTLLFSFGVFLVILFTFQSKIGEAAILRAAAGPDQVKMEEESRLQSILPKGKNSREEITNDDERKKYEDDAKKVHDEFKPKYREADEEKLASRISNIRSIRNDRYGVMFGFLFVAFGCIGYLRTEQPLVMRIVAAVILSYMMIVVFSSFGGCGDKLPPIASDQH
jgi:predicted Zn finger-like uncharacterized protein